MSRQMFIVYDERANPCGSTDDASVLVSEHSLKAARRWDGPGYIWSYDIGAGNELVNEQFIGPTRVLERMQQEAD